MEILLANLQSQFTDAYPDVVRLKTEIAELKSNPERGGGGQGNLNNPAYVNLKSQVSSVERDIRSLERQIVEYSQKEDVYRKRIETSLRVEEEYRSLTLKRGSTQDKYNDLMQKLMEAKVSSGLEEEQKGERFTLLEPASYPAAPYKPNRLMIILLGFVAGFGIGTGVIAFKEYADRSIYDVDILARETSFPVLGCIPEIITQDDIARKRRLRMVVFAGLFLIIVGIVIAVTYFPL